MSKFAAQTFDKNQRVKFRGASEEETVEFIQSMLQELAIMMCFVAAPSEAQKKISDTIAIFEAHLDRHPQQQVRPKLV
jgi:hypothetical protein